MGKNNSKNISKDVSGKYSQKFHDHTKQSAIDANKELQKKAETIGDLIRYKIADKFTKISRTSPQNISVTVKSKTVNIRLIETYLKKDMYLQKKGRKLLTI